MTWLYIVLIILAVIGFLLLIPIKVIISFAVDDDNNEILVRYMFLKFRIYPGKEKKSGKKTQEEKSEKQKKTPDIKKYLHTTWDSREDIKKGISDILYYMIHHAVTVNELNISACFGFDDAMKTGIAAGWINAAVYNFIGLLDRFSRIRKWNVSLKPDFNSKCIKAGIYCVISTNTAHIFALGGIMLKMFLKFLRNIKKYEKTEPKGEK